MAGPAWVPTDPAATNVGRFMSEHGIADFDRLVRLSIEEPEWFWDAVVRFLGIEFATPYQRVLDVSRGIPWARWFTGGTLNFADVCLRHPSDRPAVVWEGEDGQVRRWTYGELRAAADGLAALLAARGVGEGDAVGVFLPMLPETVATLLAVAKLGAVFLPLFSGYAPAAVATRLEDAGAKALVTADGFLRRGSVVPMHDVARQAVAAVPSVQTTVVVPRLGQRVEYFPGPEVLWPRPAEKPSSTPMVDSEHPLFIAYTSGTTGRPKG